MRQPAYSTRQSCILHDLCIFWESYVSFGTTCAKFALTHSCAFCDMLCPFCACFDRFYVRFVTESCILHDGCISQVCLTLNKGLHLRLLLLAYALTPFGVYLGPGVACHSCQALDYRSPLSPAFNHYQRLTKAGGFY